MNKADSKFKMILVLAAVCFISALLLSYVSVATRQKIEDNNKLNTEKALNEVLAGLKDYEIISAAPVIYKGFSSDGQLIGYAVISEGMGFQGTISLMLGFSPELDKMTGMVILDSVETPGLGDRIKEESFRGQFVRALNPEKAIKIETITGATISSVAVEKIANKALEDVKRIH